MIKSIQLKNFQAHSNTVLDFVPEVNIIIGSSDSGKTSVLRALNLIVHNRPSGGSCKKNNTDEMEVIVALEDGVQITRLRSNKDNKYILDGEELKAFGTEVPAPVKEKLNFSDLNIQYQFDSPFLLAETNGEAGRILNKIVRLDVIDSSLQKIESKKRKSKQDLIFRQTEIENQSKELQKYEGVNKLREQTVSLFFFIEQINKKTEQLEKIKQTSISLIDKYNAVEKYEHVKEHKFQLISAQRLYTEQVEQTEYLSRIGVLLQKLLFSKTKINSFSEIETNKKTVLAAIEKTRALTKLKNIYNQLITNISLIKDKKTVLKSKNETIIYMRDEQKKLMPDVCPLCGQEIRE